jgi:hypothetical protein
VPLANSDNALMRVGVPDMKLYADRPVRLLRQLLGDVLLVVLIGLCVRLGQSVRDHVEALAGPGRDAEAAGLRFQHSMRDAAGSLSDVPLVGDGVSAPFRGAAASGRDLAEAAKSYQESVADLARVLGLTVALIPVLLLLALWVPRRVTWVVAATAAARLSRAGHGARDLLALRALSRRPLPELNRLSPDIAAAWRAGEPAAIDDLAALELDDLGLRLPPQG